MREAPSQDGVAALRQRLFFASAMLQLAERELAGDALNRLALARACRNSAVLQLHAVLTGFLDDIVVRLRLDPQSEVPTLRSTRQALSARGLTSPELGRLDMLLEPGGWLRHCEDEARRCLSSRAIGSRDGAARHRHEEEAAGGDMVPRRIRLAGVAGIEVLSADDFTRIRSWIGAWNELLDEFLVTLDEF